MARVILWVGVLLGLAGCQSLRSWQEGCPGVYSGLRYYGEQVGELPFDGKVFFSFDLIPSAIVDSVALPVTAFANPTPPLEGYTRGCRWAAPGAIRRR